MENYPPPVAAIVNDYFERVKKQLRAVPAGECTELLREIDSHIYEAYRQMPGDDEVVRILAVLRNLGEPADVVADRLPGAMVRSGASKSVPLHVLGGILIALFGIPLGFGGVAVLTGILVTLTAMVLTYYAAMGACLLVAAVFLALGLVRIYASGLWEHWMAIGVLQLDDKLARFLEPMTAGEQGVLSLVIGAIFLAAGLAMLFGGRHLVRGLRFLYSLALDWVRRLAQAGRRRWRQGVQEGIALPRVSFVK